MRLLVAGVAVVLVAVAFAACTSRGGGSGSGSTSPAVRIVDAPIESVDILVRESYPPGYTLHIVSGLPSGCARFHLATVMERTGNNIAVKVTNSMPADPETVCTAIYGLHETNLDLGTNFASGQAYTVDVNGTTKSFVAQ